MPSEPKIVSGSIHSDSSSPSGQHSPVRSPAVHPMDENSDVGDMSVQDDSQQHDGSPLLDEASIKVLICSEKSGCTFTSSLTPAISKRNFSLTSGGGGVNFVHFSIFLCKK